MAASTTTLPYPFMYGDFPLWAQKLIREYQYELDILCPEWRVPRRITGRGPDELMRIKWLLKRHMLLTNRDGDRPAPRDWAVIVASSKKGMCFAHSIDPASSNTAPEVTREPAKAAADTYVRVESTALPALAFELRLPLEVVEGLAEHAPETCYSDDELARYIRGVVQAIRTVSP